MMQLLLIDFHDSNTQILADLVFRVLGVRPSVLAYDDPSLDEGAMAGADGILLATGPGLPDDAGDVGRVPNLVAGCDSPVLGIGLGHQILAGLCGARIVPIEPRLGVVSRLHVPRDRANDPRSIVIDGQQVVGSHSSAVREPTERMVVDAVSDDHIQAFHAIDRPWWGLQFNPESALTEGGGENIRAWARAAGLLPHAPAGRTLLSQEVPMPDLSRVARLMVGDGPFFWLDEARPAHDGPGWSYLGLGGDVVWPDEGVNVLEVLRRSVWQGVGGPDAPFTGGWVGVSGYEPGTALWMSAQRWVAVDHERQRAWLVAREEPGAQEWLDRTAAALSAPVDDVIATVDADLLTAVRSLPHHRRDDDDSYRAKVEQAHEHLRAGTSFEVCLTTTAEVAHDASREELLELYLLQRRTNPAPYAAFLACDDTTIMSSSPERFLRVRDGEVESRPIKGTLPRGETPEADAALRTRLETDPKLRSELVMIVDLLRNDLAKVCVPGSVACPEPVRVDSFATVHQLAGVVTGLLGAGVDIVDLLRAAFPGGSMTGAPKHRTMEILADLESGPRGYYSGALGWISGDRDAELSVVIRTLVHDDGVLSVGAGGAVVPDSTPQGELDEMLLKMSAALP